MGNKTKGNKQGTVIKADRCFKIMSEQIQKELEQGELSLSFVVDGKEIDITEELSASIMLMEAKQQAVMVHRFMDNVDFDTVGQLTSDKIFYKHNDFTVLNSITTAERVHMRYLALQAFKSNNKACGEVITMVTFKALEAINGRSKLMLEYGVDDCIVATVLYWASQKGILKEIYKWIPENYFGDSTVDCEKSYKDTLVEMNTTLGEAYYNFKTGVIDREEYLKAIVSENGQLPIPRAAGLMTSPEFSWQVVEDIVGKKRLTEMDYSDEVKEVISQIFQCYYSSVYNFFSSTYEYIIQGYFYEVNKDKINNAFKQLEYHKVQSAKQEIKAKETKASVKGIRKELETLKKENKILKTTNESTEGKLDKLTKQGLTDIEPYQKQLEKKDEQLAELRGRLTEMQRVSNKKGVHSNELSSCNKDLKEQVDFLEISNGELKDKVNSLLSSYNDECIPLECIVNSIKNNRIIIFGGDMMHSTLKNLGFKNLRLVKANDKALGANEIKHADALVMVTGYLSHASSSTPRNTAESYGTPIMYFNNKSANKLCRDLFTFLNSDKYKK